MKPHRQIKRRTFTVPSGLPTIFITTSYLLSFTPPLFAKSRPQTHPSRLTSLQKKSRPTTNPLKDENGRDRIPPRPFEWQELPAQNWEFPYTSPDKAKQVERADTRWRVRTRAASKPHIPLRASEDQLDVLAIISGARTPSELLGLNDLVVLEEFEGLELGGTYTIISEPERINSSKSDRMAYQTKNLGELQILNRRDDRWIAKITKAYEPIPRGAAISKVWDPFVLPPLIPAPEPMEALTIFSPTDSTEYSSAHKFVFVDRGSIDEIRPGMVFRIFQNNDPATEKDLGAQDSFIEADLLVVQVSDRYSTAYVLRSSGVIENNTRAILLSDISDVIYSEGFQTSDAKKLNPQEVEMDELDKISSDELNDAERRELEQLEKHHDAPPGQMPDPSMSDPSPNHSAPETDGLDDFPSEPLRPSGATSGSNDPMEESLDALPTSANPSSPPASTEIDTGTQTHADGLDELPRVDKDGEEIPSTWATSTDTTPAPIPSPVPSAPVASPAPSAPINPSPELNDELDAAPNP